MLIQALGNCNTHIAWLAIHVSCGCRLMGFNGTGGPRLQPWKPTAVFCCINAGYCTLCCRFLGYLSFCVLLAQSLHVVSAFKGNDLLLCTVCRVDALAGSAAGLLHTGSDPLSQVAEELH